MHRIHDEKQQDIDIIVSGYTSICIYRKTELTQLTSARSQSADPRRRCGDKAVCLDG